MRITRLVTVGVLLCAAAPASGQGYDGSYDALPPPHCVIPDSAMVRVPVYTWVRLPDARAESYRTLAENLMQDIVERVPALLGVPPDTFPRGEPQVRWSDLGNPLVITGYRDGRITWQPSRGAHATAAELLGRAVAAAVADGTKFPWDSSMTGDSVRFDIVFAWPRVDGGKHQHTLDVRQAATPVFSIAYPTMDLVVLKRGNHSPSYPNDARNAGFGGRIFLLFTVDTAGRAVMSTVHDEWNPKRPRLDGATGRMYEEFVDASRNVLPSFEFSPAVLGGSCKMPQIVRMPFVFTLEQLPTAPPAPPVPPAGSLPPAPAP